MDNNLAEAIISYLLQRVHYLEAQLEATKENYYVCSDCSPEEFWENK